MKAVHTPFSIVKENAYVPGCTVSQQLLMGPSAAFHAFSLAPRTDISPETYAYPKLLTVLDGAMTVQAGRTAFFLSQGNSLIVPLGVAFGVHTESGAIYTELSTKEDLIMNLEAGQLFVFKDLVPTEARKIVNRDVVSSPHMKLALMGFGEGTGLTEHAAPGKALVMALEGKAVITYEGTDHLISAGESFVFDKGGRHAVTAQGPFKMALLLVLD